MEKRESKRISLSVDAEITTRGNSYSVSVENISQRGMCLVAPTSETVEDFIPGTTLGISFAAPTGEKISQHCEIKWLRIDAEPLIGLIYSIGLQAIAPPPIYNEVYMKLL